MERKTEVQIESEASGPGKMAGRLEKISRLAIYLLVFLLPLWFLPFTQNVLNYQKQIFLIVFTFLGIAALLAKSISRGELLFRKSWLHLPVLLVLVVVGISTIFSLWPYASFWGWPLDLTDNFVTISGFVLLYFLIVNAIEDQKQLFKLFFLFVLSGALAGLYGLLQIFQLHFLPFDFARISSFNTIGTVNSLAVFAASLLPLTLALAFVSRFLLRTFFWLIIFLLLAVVVIINFFDAWLALLAGLLVLLAFGIWNIKKRAEFGWISFPMALIVLALFFMMFRIALPGAAIPLEISPSLSAELDIVTNVIKERPWIGSGPGTFSFDYAKFHSPLLNQTIFWGTRFASGASEILDWIATKGIFGGLALLGLIIGAIVFSIRGLMKLQVESFRWMMGLGILASLAAVITSQIFYPANFSLWVLFWVLLGGLGVFLGGEFRKISLAPSSFLALGFSFLFLIVLIFGFGLLFLGGQKYLAEVWYLQGIRAFGRGELDLAITKVLAAANLNPSVDLYWRDLSQLYLARVNQIAADQDLSDEERQQQTQVAIANAVTSAQQTARVAPANVANWNVQGFVYRSLIGIPNADTFAISSYQRAIELEPASPFSWAEIGRVYLFQAQNLARQEGKEKEVEQALNQSLEQLNKALELKSDYAPAHYLIALVYQQQGKTEEAISKLEETKLIAPNDIGLAFQLGVIYWQKEQSGKAQLEFERAKNLNPNYSNARYMLGLVYDKQGKREKAKTEFSAVAELNPDNEEIKKIIANLEAGKPALEGITPAQPPIQETPPEITEKSGEEK